MKFLCAFFFLVGSLQLVAVQSQPPPGGIDLSELFLWKPSNNTTKITKIEESILQNVSQILPKNGFFYDLNPHHGLAVSLLKDVLMEQTSPKEWFQLATDLRDREEMNPHVWLRAVVASIVHRPDIPEGWLPPIAQVVPSLFFPKEVLSALKSQKLNTRAGNESCAIVDESYGVDNGEENLLWYWREDVMLNAHHWYWHLANPIRGSSGPDRMGELFDFFHHDMMARFHCERLSVGLPQVISWFLEPRGRIPPAYNPHLHDGNSGLDWTPRPANATVSDIVSDVFGSQIFINLINRNNQLKRIMDGISVGYLVSNNNTKIPLNTLSGLSSLGNIVQANWRSENPERYGTIGIHSDGHIITSLVMDPFNQKGLPPGVMGDTATSVRDIIFYPYHDAIGSIFDTLKLNLPSYKLTQGEWPLLLEGISIQSIGVRTGGLPPNQLETFWSTAKYDLARGLDFERPTEEGPLWVCAKHLDHGEFQYELQIVREEEENVGSVTVRIFMAPEHDLNGRRYSLEEQRRYMFILDVFTVLLQVGTNTILRNSTDTPLTIGLRQHLGQLQNGTSGEDRPYCGCGWPHYLLLPKGNKAGLPFVLFAILTNAEEDAVEIVGSGDKSCKPAHVQCGLMGEKYPDTKPMGYPFDKKLFVSDGDSDNGAAYLDNLVQQLPNSAYVQVKVTHFDEFRQNAGK